MPEQDEFGGLAVEDSPVTPPAAREVSKDEFGGISLDDEALQFATSAPQQVTNTLTRTLRSGAEGSEMAREAPRNRLEAAYEALALPPGAQEGRERMAGGYGYSESLLPIPTFTPKEGEPGYMTVGKEVANIALGLPKFLTSPTGITAAPLGFVAPTITAGAFTEDMLNSLGEQAANTYKNWGSMNPTQKTAAVTQMAGTGLFAGLTGAATIKGLRQPPAVGPRVPITPGPIEPKPLPTAEAEATESARLAAELGQEETPAAAPTPPPAPAPAPVAAALPALPAEMQRALDKQKTATQAGETGPYPDIEADAAQWQNNQVALQASFKAGKPDMELWRINEKELKNKYKSEQSGSSAPAAPITPAAEFKPVPAPKTFNTVEEVADYRGKVRQSYIDFFKSLGMTGAEATRFFRAYDARSNVEVGDLYDKLSPENKAKIDAFDQAEGDGFYDFDRAYDPSKLQGDWTNPELAQEVVSGLARGGEELPNRFGDQLAYLGAALRKLRDAGGTWSDIAKALDSHTTRISNSQGDKLEVFKLYGDRIRRFAAQQGIELPQGELGAKIPGGPAAAALPAYTGPDAVEIVGKPLGEWFKATKAEDLPKGAERAELAKRIGVANQPKKILAALKNSQKRIREIVSPPLKPEEAIPAPAATPLRGNLSASVSESGTVSRITYHDHPDGKEVGYGQLDGRVINYVEVKPEFQKKGFGTQIINDLVERGGEIGITTNPAGRHMMEKAGFKEYAPDHWALPGTPELKAPVPETKPAEPETPPQSPPMGAAAPYEFEHNPSTPTGIRNAVVDKERAKRGLPEAMQAAKRSFGEVWDRAMAIIDRDPVAQDNLLNELRDKPRALTDTEDALILHRQIDLQNEYGKATRDLAQAFDDGRMDAVATEKVRVSSLADKLLEVYNIGKTSGTETARGLSARRMMANEDFSLAKMVTEKRAANGGKPLTEAQNAEIERLNKIIEATQKALDDYKKRAAERRGGGQKPSQPPAPDPEVEKIRADNERSKRLYREGLMRDRLRNRTPLEKTQDWIVKWRRAFILSSPITLAKLTSAAAERMAFTPLEEAAGSLIGRAIPSVAAKAGREGGISARAEARALTEGFTKGLRDSWEVLRTGRSSLDELYGRAAGYPPGVSDFFGHVHGALKSVPKRAEFARSFEKRAQQAIAQGVDVSDPLVQARLSVESYKDANRAIFQQDNRVVSAYKAALRTLEQKSKETGKVPTGSKAVATAGKILLPIVRIPTNIVAETLQTSTGLVTGSARLGRAFARGIENLSPQEADIIMRSLKKGSLGAALLALGFFNPDVIGGYYQPGKRKPGQQGFGTVQVYGHEIPSYLLHNPLLETMQIGATARKLAESKISKKDAEAQGMGWGAFGAGMGLLEEVPFLREPIEIAKAFNPNERRAFMGELFKSLTVPQGVQWWAAYQDTDQYGQPIKRNPVTLAEHIETGIPGLREGVPAKKNP